MALRRRVLLVSAAACVLVGGVAGQVNAAGDGGDDLKQPFVTQKSPPNTPGVQECVAKGDPSANVNLDCDDPYPNDEPNIAVDPTDPLHMVASSNDYGSCCDQYYTTFDGGSTWRTGNMSRRGPYVIGSDPISVFDRKHDTVIHFSLNFNTNNGTPGATNGDIVSSVSKDGGIHWKTPVVVANGLGAHLFIDKEDGVVDNDPSSPYYGRAYVTWTGFIGSAQRTLSSPIMMAYSDDGGFTWSRAQEISGFNPQYCTYQEDGPAGQCDEDQASSPRVGPGGVLTVAFMNEQNQASWEPGDQFEDQYMTVTSHDGGVTFDAPMHVVNLEDGTRDYPLNVDGRQTLSGMQLRVWGAGSLAIDPETGQQYLTFSDNRAGMHDVNSPVTQSRAYIVTSQNGTNWSSPQLVDSSGTESWFPWVDVAPDGKVGVIYNDRRPGNTYVAELAEGSPGSFSQQVLSTALSRPNESVFFQAGAEDCMPCATFHGDYLGLDYGSDGAANTVWTDMRDEKRDTGLYRQFVYFARR